MAPHNLGVLLVVLSHNQVSCISISLTHDIEFVFLTVLHLANAIIFQFVDDSLPLKAAPKTILD